MRKSLFIFAAVAMLGAGCVIGTPKSAEISSSGSPLDPKAPIIVSPEQNSIKDTPFQPSHVVATSTGEEPKEQAPVVLEWNLYFNPETRISFEYPDGEGVSGGATPSDLRKENAGLADLIESYSIGTSYASDENAPAEGPAGRRVELWENPKGLSLETWAAEHHSYTDFSLNDSYDRHRKDVRFNGMNGFIYSTYGMYSGRTVLLPYGKKVIKIDDEIESQDDQALTHIAESIRWTK